MDIPSMEIMIRKIFDYCNGRANVVNYPAVLYINYSSINGPLGYGEAYGAHTSPNKVTLYMNPLLSDYDEFTLSVMVTYVIVHELFHVDQKILYTKIYDINYLKRLEADVEIMSSTFLYYNMDIIANLCGFGYCRKFLYDDILYNENKDNIVSLYERKTLESHIIGTVSELIINPEHVETYLMHMHKAFTNLSNISVEINDKVIPIIYNKKIISIEEFNTLITEAFFKYSYRIMYNYGMDYYRKTDTLVIKVDVKLSSMIAILDRKQDQS